MDKNAFLSHISNYIILTSEEEELLLSKVRRRKFLKGQYVSQGGDICKYINFVISGSLKSFHLDNEGNEHILAFAIEDWWIGDLGSFTTQKPADYTIQCIENCELAQLSYGDLQFLYTEIPKLERFFRILIQNAYVYFQRRIIDNLSLTAKEKYLNFIKQYPQFEQRVPQYLIASYLGFTPEFLSKIKKEIAIKSSKS